MKKFSHPIRPKDILAVCGGIWQGEIKIHLDNVCEPGEADSGSIIFLEQDRLLDTVKTSTAGLIITNQAMQPMLEERPLLIVEKPYFSFMTLVTWCLMQETQNQDFGIHPSAIIDPTVKFDGEVAIGPNVVIKANCTLGKGVRIAEACSIGSNTEIGAGTRLYANVSVYDDTVIGRKCIIHSGCVIGADGFGFILIGGKQEKIPQVGNVRIGDEVEIGANTTIDRATLGSTVIGKGTKIDNLVQIGHNCTIGEHSILCAQVGLAGSTTVGDYVYLAGQVGAAGHIKIGNRVMVGAQSGLTTDIPEAAKYFGSPAVDAGIMKRIIVAQRHLPEIYRAWQNNKGENDGL
jgi:UDP-3-O-[3-hydroxymyristoyl] glucosamine N-acyltransferase